MLLFLKYFSLYASFSATETTTELLACNDVYSYELVFLFIYFCYDVILGVT
jgi:hypothetical protein